LNVCEKQPHVVAGFQQFQCGVGVRGFDNAKTIFLEQPRTAMWMIRSPSAVWMSPTNRWDDRAAASLPRRPPGRPAFSSRFRVLHPKVRMRVRLSTSGVRTTRGDGRGWDAAATHPPRPPPPGPALARVLRNAVEFLGVSPKSAKRIGGKLGAIHRFARRLC
jgi:hypothetical protein